MNLKQLIVNTLVGQVLADKATKTEVRVVINGQEQVAYSSKTDPSEAAKDVAANGLPAFQPSLWKIEVKGTEVHVNKK
jgi:hypothetical protein